MKRKNRQNWPLIVVLMIFFSPLLMVELSHAWNNSSEDMLVQTEPISIDYASFLGGNMDDYSAGVLADSADNLIVYGRTVSPDFPATIGAGPTTGTTDLFVAKFNADNLTEPMFITVFGGQFADFPWDAVIDAEDNVYLSGGTQSTIGFSTPGVFDSSYNGGTYDGFVCKVAPNGSLVYSTYIGGNGYDLVTNIGLDSSNDIWVSGYTRSDDYPVTEDAFDKVYEVDQPIPDPDFTKGECFYAKISNNGSKLLYSSYLGGEAKEGLWGMKIDDTDNLIFSGRTFSSNFPITENAWDKHLSGSEDMFLTKFSSNGSGLLYSTFIGGTGMEGAWDIDVDPDGNYILVGITNSSDFPVSVNAYDTTFDGDSDAFILKLLADGSSLIFSTYLGGTGPTSPYSDEVSSVEYDETTSDIYFSGHTNSTDWPTTDGSTHKGVSDAVIGILSSDGSTLKYSTLIGGSGREQTLWGYFRFNSNEAYLAPWTSSTDFKVTSDAYQSTYGGGAGDGTLMKITFPDLSDTTTTTEIDTNTTTTSTAPSNGGTSAFEFTIIIPLLTIMAISIRIFRRKKDV